MSKGGLAFLNKKSWHTGTLKNAEKVWLAEQKAGAEQKRLDQLRKELDEERGLLELKKIQAEAGLVSRGPNDRLDWMYAGAGAHAAMNREKLTEEYLSGKEFKPDKSKDDDIKKLTNVPTSTSAPSVKVFTALEEANRMREDPLMAIRAEELKQREAVLHNPITMRKIREEVALRERLTKELSKRHKKRKRKVRNDHDVIMTTMTMTIRMVIKTMRKSSVPMLHVAARNVQTM